MLPTRAGTAHACDSPSVVQPAPAWEGPAVELEGSAVGPGALAEALAGVLGDAVGPPPWQATSASDVMTSAALLGTLRYMGTPATWIHP